MTDLCSKYSNNLSLNGESEKCWKNNGSSNATNNSTLSLRISAYENSDDTSSDSINKSFQKSLLIQKQKQINPASKFVSQSTFEFERQQNDKLPEPEVSQFRASQRLLKLNSASSSTSSILNSDIEQNARREVNRAKDYGKDGRKASTSAVVGSSLIEDYGRAANNQYVEIDKRWFAQTGAGCRTDNGIEGTNKWIKVIFITRRLPLLAAADKMKMFLVKARDTNYGTQEIHITNADWIKSYDFAQSKPKVRHDVESNCYYIKRSSAPFNNEQFYDLLDSMELVEWNTNDVFNFLTNVAVVAPSDLYEDVFTCNCPVGVQRKMCKHVLLIQVRVLRTKEFPYIAAMRQSDTETGRNKSGRPRKYPPALSRN